MATDVLRQLAPLTYHYVNNVAAKKEYFDKRELELKNERECVEAMLNAKLKLKHTSRYKGNNVYDNQYPFVTKYETDIIGGSSDHYIVYGTGKYIETKKYYKGENFMEIISMNTYDTTVTALIDGKYLKYRYFMTETRTDPVFEHNFTYDTINYIFDNFYRHARNIKLESLVCFSKCHMLRCCFGILLEFPKILNSDGLVENDITPRIYSNDLVKKVGNYEMREYEDMTCVITVFKHFAITSYIAGLDSKRHSDDELANACKELGINLEDYSKKKNSKHSPEMIKTTYHETQLEYATNIIIQEFGAGGSKPASGDTKITYDQKDSEGNVITSSTTYFEGGKKIAHFDIGESGNLDVATLQVPTKYKNQQGMLGYKLLKTKKLTVVAVLDIYKNSFVDTGYTHDKYRTNKCGVLDIFAIDIGRCVKCGINSIMFTEGNFTCSRHSKISSSFKPKIHIKNAHSYFSADAFVYKLGEDAVPNNGVYIVKKESCGIGIHYCNTIYELCSYIHGNGGIDTNAFIQYAELSPDIIVDSVLEEKLDSVSEALTTLIQQDNPINVSIEELEFLLGESKKDQ